MPKCRMCSTTNLYKFLDLGNTPPSDKFLFAHQITKEECFPLEVMSCLRCGLAQLSYVVPGKVLFDKDYPYEASTTQTACKHWDDFAQSLWNDKVNKGDLVVDIGSNVGVLLKSFKDRGARVIGVDPAENIARKANDAGIKTIVDFFNTNVASKITSEEGQATIITATNVFAHIDDLDSFMEAVLLLLKPEGFLVIESPHFMALVRDFLYDTIYHEHLSYLSVKPLVRFFSKFDMEICDIRRENNHGESFRYFVRRKSGLSVSDVVDDILTEEEESGIYSTKVLDEFTATVKQNREELRNIVSGLKKQGKRLAIVSAPAKGMTLLSYCGFGNDVFDFITEKSKLKIGKVTPGTHIPVVSDEMLFEKKPDYVLLLAWNFSEEIMKNLEGLNLKFIIPMPHPRIV